VGWRRVGGNVLLLAGAVAIGRLSALAVFSVVAHQLGAGALGTFGIVSAYTAYWFFLTDVGLSQRMVRDVAADPSTLQDDFAASLSLKVAILAVPALAIVVAQVGWGEAPSASLFCLLTAGMCVQSLAYTFECAARARERNLVEAVSSAVQAVVMVVSAVALLAAGAGIVGVGVAALAGATVRLAISAALARRWVGVRPRWRWQPSLLRRSSPYLLTTITTTAYVGIDVAIIGLITDPQRVGNYIAVSRLMLAFSFLVNYAGNAALPAAVRAFQSSRDHFLRMGRRLTLSALSVGLLLTAAGAAVAEPVLRVLYGAEFVGATGVFRIATLYLPLAAVSAVSGLLLTAAGRQRERAKAVLAGLVATVVLCLALVGWLGSLGAVLQFVLSQLVLTVVLVRRFQLVGSQAESRRPTLRG
jgi:O-antigen/teichoic acid export membrane protein